MSDRCRVMSLTGRADGPPLVPPAAVVERARALGSGIDVDVVPLLAERAAADGLTRAGHVSCGGATRLLPAPDGWVAVCLARPDDVDLIPAWLEVAAPPVGDPWPGVAAALAGRPAAEAVDRGALLGLPVAVVGEVAPPAHVVRRRRLDPVRRSTAARPPLVVDLSSLWAGPLCARLLAERGARVTKVEAIGRPDGARRSPRFFERFDRGRRHVTLDFRAPDGVQHLHRLLESADVVIEASRPRALEQLGVDAADVVRRTGNVWISITGYGREGRGRDRVAFGDDAAAAGGLVAWDDRGPCFVADAVADPLTGVAAAAAAVAALDAGGGWLLDVAMARVAAHVAGGDTRWTPAPGPV